MGPISKAWCDEHGDYWSGGRIDIRDSSKQGYDGWDEYAVAPMHGSDWNALSDWLDELQTETLLPYKELISQFEKDYGKAISWAADKTEKL